MTEITIPKSLEEAGREYGFGMYDYGPFCGCTNLKTVKLEKGLTQIAGNLFMRCYGLENIDIPDTVTTIGENAFKLCTSIRSVTIPDTVTYIGSQCFESDKELANVKLSSNIKRMERICRILSRTVLWRTLRHSVC